MERKINRMHSSKIKLQLKIRLDAELGLFEIPSCCLHSYRSIIQAAKVARFSIVEYGKRSKT